MDKEDIDNIRDNIVAQAKVFLDEMGEFFPFGAVIDNNHKLSPLGIHNGDEFPTSKDVIKDLEKVLAEGFKSGSFITGGIGLDIYLPLKDNAGKMSALEVRIINNKGLIATYRLPYIFTDSKEARFYAPIVVQEKF